MACSGDKIDGIVPNRCSRTGRCVRGVFRNIDMVPVRGGSDTSREKDLLRRQFGSLLITFLIEIGNIADNMQNNEITPRGNNARTFIAEPNEIVAVLTASLSHR